MAKYFIDTEFFEGFHKPLFGKKRHFIDLISIGIVAEDGREYYAISKDFDLKKAWNKYDLKPDINNGGVKKVYWLRENVLKPLVADAVKPLSGKDGYLSYRHCYETIKLSHKKIKEGYGCTRMPLTHIVKSNKQIAEEIKEFVSMDYFDAYGKEFTAKVKCDNDYVKSNPEFYGYYADYDWVLFCSLFGRMIDLPKGFPMYCKDLKQMLDDAIMREAIGVDSALKNGVYPVPDNYRKPVSVLFDEMLTKYKELNNYPKQENEHSALHDARWNKELYEFLNTI